MIRKTDIIHIVTVILVGVTLVACGGKPADATYYNTIYKPLYAQGFVIGCGNDSVEGIVINNPWQGADSVSMSFRVEAPARRIVAMSSTFVAMLESLGAADRIVGVSGLDFISSPSLRARGNEVADVGYDTNVDFEKIVALNPDVVLLYGVNGPNVIENKLKELNIPYLYLGDYLEQSPLGKAEWVVAVGELIGKREEAVALFDSIAVRYNALTDSASTFTSRPKVMLNAPYGDSWWMPSTANYMTQLITDAGGDYLYKENTGNASRNIDIELAYKLMSEAGLWLNPGQASSLDQLTAMTPRFTDTPVFRSGNVYNNNRRTNSGGGNDFYESGVIHPDVVLKDLIKVFHPEAFPGYEPVYFHRLK